MNIIRTKVLMIIALALASSLGLAAGVQAKPDTASHMNRAGPPSGHHMTEDRLKQMIVQEAAKTTNVTPSVALAVAKIESSFRPHVVSSAGAIGVMQIMPRTGRDLFGLSRTELFDPAINIRAGVTFLDQLIDRYGGRVDLALSHYNGGSRVTAGPQPKIIPVTRGRNTIFLKKEVPRLPLSQIQITETNVTFVIPCSLLVVIDYKQVANAWKPFLHIY